MKRRDVLKAGFGSLVAGLLASGFEAKWRLRLLQPQSLKPIPDVERVPALLPAWPKRWDVRFRLHAPWEDVVLPD